MQAEPEDADAEGQYEQVYKQLVCSTQHLLAAMLHDACSGLHRYKEGHHQLRPAERSLLVCVSGALARAFALKRAPPVLRTDGLEFLQMFLNQLVRAGLGRLQFYSSTIRLPHSVLAIEPYFLSEQSTEADRQAFEAHDLDFSPIGHAILKEVIGQGPEAEIVRATWRAVYEHGHGTGQVVLRSSEVDFCQLGDFVVFCLAELPMFMEGRLLGLCICILGQFGKWLDKAIHNLAPPCKVVDIPRLRGLVRARNLDSMQIGHLAVAMAEGSLANQIQSRQKFGDMKHQHKLMVYTYVSSLARFLATAESKTLHILCDGWRSVGEAMDLFFAYSPWLGAGGWWPFQVPPQLADVDCCEWFSALRSKLAFIIVVILAQSTSHLAQAAGRPW